MHLMMRLLQATILFGGIFVGYLLHWGLTRIYRVEVEGEGGRVDWDVPEWLLRRREAMDQRYADRLYRGMLSLRGVYIKLGQVLSIMGGMLPLVYTRKLETLQDQVPPQSFAVIEAAFERSMKRPLSDCFLEFDQSPLAAASLGQVHVARLRDGTKVAVKVLYPGIREVIRVDMRVVRIALKVYQWFVPVQNVGRAHEALVDLLRQETDYHEEARCMRQMSANFRDEPRLAFPDVVDELSTRDVLTMTFMEGAKISDLKAYEELGLERRAVAETLVEAFYKMLLLDRCFHADPHPGNFLVRRAPDGDGPQIVVLDFGAVSEVSVETVDGLVDVLQGYFEQRDDLVLRGVERIGFAAPGGDRALLEQTIKRYFSKLLRIEDTTPEALMRANPEELQALVDPGVEHTQLRRLMKSVQYPEGWFYVERASVLLFWLCAQIDPKLDTLQVGFPFILPFLAERTQGPG